MPARQTGTERAGRVTQLAVGAGRWAYGFARDTAIALGGLVGGGATGYGASQVIDRSGGQVSTLAAVGLGTLGAAVGTVVGDRAAKRGTRGVDRRVGSGVSGGDTSKLTDALSHAGTLADATAAQAAPALAMIDRIENTLSAAGGRNPPQPVRQALQDLEDARKLLKQAEELCRSARTDINDELTHIITS